MSINNIFFINNDLFQTVALPGFDYPIVIEPIDLAGAGIGVLIPIIAIIYGIWWRSKPSNHRDRLPLWIFPLAVNFSGETRIVLINLLDPSGTHLSYLFGGVFSSIDEGPIYVSTPFGTFKGFLTSSRLDDEMYSIISSGSLSRFSLLTTSTFETRLNLRHYLLITQSRDIVIYSGFNPACASNINLVELYNGMYLRRLLPAFPIAPVPF